MDRPERLYVAVDVSNLWRACRGQFGTDARLDFGSISALIPRLWPGQITQQLVAYVVSHSQTNTKAFVKSLRSYGYEIRERHMSYAKAAKTEGKPTRTDWDVGITIDAIDKANEYDTFVLMSGDGDFAQLLDYLRYRGKRTMVMSFDIAMSKWLYNSSHEIMPLDQSVVFQR